MPPLITITVVTYNSAPFLERCVQSLFTQHYRELEVIVVDNASEDETRHLLAKYAGRVRVIENAENIGFAAAQNQAIAAAKGEWVLTLNPDTWLTPGFITHLVDAGEKYRDENVGIVCGKLLVLADDGTIPARRVLDSTGIYFTPAMRHFDRGSGQLDAGQYDQPEYVVGATAAAALYRRDMIEDVSVDGEFFDGEFFCYREDADVAWRAQLMGWKCLYAPRAIGYHVRRVLPSNRVRLPAAINMHSVKNRFLMRAKNVGAWILLRTLLPAVLRDAAIVLYCLLFERSSLPAFARIGRTWPDTMRKRRWIQQRRRVPDRQIARWFRFRPASYPVPRHNVLSMAAGSRPRAGLSGK